MNDKVRQVVVHIVCGVALGAVAALVQAVGADPVISASPEVAGLIGTVVGIFGKAAHTFITKEDTQYGETTPPVASKDDKNVSE